MSDAPEFPWNTQRQEQNTARRNPLAGYDKQPKIYPGSDIPYYGIGALAYVLNRESDTMRLWERLGILPVPTTKFTSRNPKDPVTLKHGQRRLYPVEIVVGVYEIARQEGILEKRARPIGETNFAKRVQQLFRNYAEGREIPELRRYSNLEATPVKQKKDRA